MIRAGPMDRSSSHENAAPTDPNATNSMIGRSRSADRVKPYLFLGPNFAGFVLFTAGPIVAAVALSLFRYHPLKGEVDFVGLDNFVKLLGWTRDAAGRLTAADPYFYKYLKNTLVLMMAIPVNMIGALLVAMLLNQELRGRIVLRTVFFLPHLCAGVALFMLWRMMFIPDASVGVINGLLQRIGVEGPAWLQDTFWAKPALMIMMVWAAIGGYNMILYLAGLTQIPVELYEAADIDGAGWFQRLRHITWPQLAPTSFFILITSTIGGFQGGFEAAYIMTQGGPDGQTKTISYYIYENAYEWGQFGYAAAISLVLFAIILAITLINWRYGGKQLDVA